MQVASGRWERHGNGFSLRVSRGEIKNHSPANTLILTQEDPYWISNLKNYNNFALVKFFIWGNLLEQQWKTNALVIYNDKVKGQAMRQRDQCTEHTAKTVGSTN